jgi:hypothetical protein
MKRMKEYKGTNIFPIRHNVSVCLLNKTSWNFFWGLSALCLRGSSFRCLRGPLRYRASLRYAPSPSAPAAFQRRNIFRLLY